MRGWAPVAVATLACMVGGVVAASSWIEDEGRVAWSYELLPILGDGPMRERRRVMVTGGGEGWRGRVRGGGEEGVGMEVRGRIENEGGRRTGEAGGVPDRAVPSPRGAQLEVAGLRTAAVASTGLSSRWACLRAPHAWQTGVVDMFERSRSRTWLLSSRTRRALLGLVRRSRAHGPRERGHNLGVARSEDGHPHALGGWARGDAPRAWGREVARSGLASARGSAHRPSPSSTTFKTFAFARFFEASVQIRVNVRLAHGRPVCGA